MQIVWIDVPNDIHDGYETVTRSFRSSLHSLDLRSTELWKRVQICISFQCRSDLRTMKKLDIAREWFPVIRRRPTINSWD